jgi:hypothetical protein
MKDRSPMLLLAIVVLCTVAPIASAAAAHADVSGVWIVSNRSTRGYADATLKPLKELPFTLWGAQQRAKADPALDPSTRCLTMFPRHMGWPYPLQIVQTPRQLVILFEADTTFRLVYTDGRKHNPDDDPAWMGHSIGHYEGDTLIVDTVGVKDDAWLDGEGVPLSDEFHAVERIRRIEGGRTLEVVTKIEDPKVFVTPIYKRLVFNLTPDWSLMEYDCQEANRDDVTHQRPGNPGSLTPSPGTSLPAAEK